MRDLVVKSLTQLSKQRWTSLEYICTAEKSESSLNYTVCTQAEILTPRTHGRQGQCDKCEHTVINSFSCFFSMREASSRCSAAVSLMFKLVQHTSTKKGC
jgi:hypothetical protein